MTERPTTNRVRLLAFDVDGVLTDATTWWGGEGTGWVQRYSVRDGEALLRLAAGLPVLPLSRNKTAAARERIAALRLDSRWLGVDDKVVAIREMSEIYEMSLSEMAFVGDGAEDAEVFPLVGFAVAVADAHPAARAAAHRVTQAAGGARVIEEVENLLVEENLL